MDGGVKLTSERESDKSLTTLDCTKLSAWLTPTPSSSNANPADASPTDLRGELSRALAEGTARLRSGTKTLTGDLIDYNPADGTALAGSRDNSTVTLFDDESASPVTARGILWDMKRGRVEVKAPRRSSRRDSPRGTERTRRMRSERRIAEGMPWV